MTPAIGQIWTDNDPRMRNRSVRILDIETKISPSSGAAYAVRKVVIKTCDPATGKMVDTRKSRVQLDRFQQAFSYSGLFVERGDGR